MKVQSNDGKLPLHYNLASAYFIENLIKKQNGIIYINLKRFNIYKIDDFYLNNKNYIYIYISKNN